MAGTSSSSDLKIHLLDMGTEKYGDCLLIQLNTRTILIDGAHASDWQDHGDMVSIPGQLAEILGEQKTFTVDLLIVTHCHADHIGCLPTLIQNGVLKAKNALVADEKLGFGRAADAPASRSTPRADSLAAAMREEDHSDLSDMELTDFLEDAATLEQRYGAMLKKMAADRTTIVRYGRDDHSALVEEFSDFGLEILGPTKEHLAICAEAIAKFNSSANEAASTDLSRVSLESWYRSMMSASDADANGEDRPGKGAALNNQSIVLKLMVGNVSVLLAGDMQFAKPEITGLAPAMKALRANVKSAGPYTFIKLTHHSSYNGMDDSVLAEWSATKSFAHTGGSNDAGHPDSGVLQLLEEHTQEIKWARTDHNGLIGVTFNSRGARLDIAKGDLNDATPNGDTSAAMPVTQVLPAVQVNSAEVIRSPIGGNTEVSFNAKLDPTVSRFTVTFDIERKPPPAIVTGTARSSPISGTRSTPLKNIPDKQAPGTTPIGIATINYSLPTDRELPNLLFVSNSEKLGYNLGSSEAAAVFAAIQNVGHALLDVRNTDDPFPEVRAELSKGYVGVVVIGGYDILPSMRVDVLPPSLRATLGPRTNDADNFIVWSDATYGDRDGDLQAEVPVSRIPDARSPNLVAAALGAKLPQGDATRFGIRNSARPFANGCFANIPGAAPAFVCETDGPSNVGMANGAMNYIMLHGSDLDATRYWGEDSSGTIEAMNLKNVPSSFSGVVFAGCCWGALTVESIASRIPSGQVPAVRTPGASLALSWLHAGTMAYVGCTGSHYSPTIEPYQYFGAPMHDAFWKRYNQGEAPAKALFGAKLDYLQGLPHGQSAPIGQAIELKIFKQFTCLGLGW